MTDQIVRNLERDAECAARKYKMLTMGGGLSAFDFSVVVAIACALTGWAWHTASGVLIVFAIVTWLGLLMASRNARWTAPRRHATTKPPGKS